MYLLCPNELSDGLLALSLIFSCNGAETSFTILPLSFLIGNKPIYISCVDIKVTWAVSNALALTELRSD